MIVFVYGTLKKGFNNAPILDDQEFLGKAVSLESRFKIYEMTQYSYPFPAVVEHEEGYKIYGELYDISTRCEQVLDHLEGVAVGLYQKKVIPALGADGRKYDDALLYVFARSIDGCEHVGPCWPKKEINRFKLADRIVRLKEKEIVIAGVRLWDKRNDQWKSPPMTTEKELREWADDKRHALGGDEYTLWSTRYFEQKQDEIKKKGNTFWFANLDKQPISPEFESVSSLAEWSTKNSTLFGGDTAEKEEWATIIQELIPQKEAEE